MIGTSLRRQDDLNTTSKYKQKQHKNVVCPLGGMQVHNGLLRMHYPQGKSGFGLRLYLLKMAKAGANF